MTKAKQELAQKQESNIVQHPAVTQTSQVMTSLMGALDSGNLQPEQLGMILDAQERVLDRQAKQDFNIAMAECQSEMPQILKAQYNEQTRSNYEGLDGLNKMISPVYTKHGFGISFGTDDCPREDFERVTAELMHKGGWNKTYHYDLPLDIAGIKGSVNKTKIHATGSTMSYGRRYLLKMIFNLTTSDEIDDDGNSAGTMIEYIDDKQLGILRDLINSTETDETFFSAKVCKVASLDLLPVEKYTHAHKLLTDKQEKSND